MRIDYLTSFDRSFKKLGVTVQKEIHRTIEAFLNHLVRGNDPKE